ncbi:MAG: retron system putative HNH endonuclease [Synechococcales bacterium]|nr:retron system putative HNH endonuclease [Synechococcales bacterium]
MANENWQPSWKDLRDDKIKPDFKPKTVLHESLLWEQGYICCYCGRRICRASSHIEHLKPRTTFPELSLCYLNLLASCPGYLEEEDSKSLTESQCPQEHCGHKKGSWYEPQLMVSPLEIDCEEYFRYTAFGEILPTNAPERELAAQETIERLGLNHVSLERARRQAVEATLLIMDGLDAEDLQRLVESYEQPNEEGKYVRFCEVVLYFLKSAVANSQS